MFDRFTNYHSLNNLIWVWTSDESNNALDWYPGDDCVDIVGRDYYYDHRAINNGSLMASFEKLKDIYGGKKIVTLAECGSVPYPDSMKADGAGWSYFMPWWDAINSWTNENPASDWVLIMNNNYMITLDKMPGWANYNPSAVLQQSRVESTERVTLRSGNGFLELAPAGQTALAVELFNLKGARIATLNKCTMATGAYRFNLDDVAKGTYIARVKSFNSTLPATPLAVQPVLVK
jgi:mannan endo-1,4-beta-mannosidase